MSNIFEERKWVEEFINLYFSGNDEHIRRAISLKDYHIPRSLFRYRSLGNEHVFSEISKEEIWLSKPEDFNDRLDCSAYFSMKKIIGENEEIKNAIEKTRQHFPQYANDILKKTNLFLDDIEKKDSTRYNDTTRRRLRICCFTEGDGNNSPTNLPLWYHYADKYRGVCIEYDMRYFSHKSIHRLLMFPVNYVPQYTDFTSVMSDFFEKKKFGIDKMFSIHKALDWNYEREWRLVLRDEDYPSQLFPFPIIRAVYMGNDICQEHEERLTKMAEDNNFSLYKMDIHYLGITFNQVFKATEKIFFKKA